MKCHSRVVNTFVRTTIMSCGWLWLAALPIQTIAQDKPAELQGSSHLTLETNDGIYLSANYWTPQKSAKDTPVVVLMHEWGKDQRDLFGLASQLYQDGFGVLTFDFRGHGESRQVDPEKYKGPRSRGGYRPSPSSRQSTKERIDAETEFRTGREIGEFFIKDIDAVKDFLVDKNNAGQLNLKCLGIIGSEFSCSVVLEWMNKHEYPEKYSAKWSKQGGDLYSLVLVTPWRNYKGLTAPAKFGKGSEDVRMLVVASKGKHNKDAKSLVRSLKVPTVEQAKKAKAKNRSFYRPESLLFEVDSTLEGTELLRPPVDLGKYIRGYLKKYLRNSQARLWKEHKKGSESSRGFGTAQESRQ